MQPDFQEPIGIDLHESGIAAPSPTLLDGQLAILATSTR